MIMLAHGPGRYLGQRLQGQRAAHNKKQARQFALSHYQTTMFALKLSKTNIAYVKNSATL